MYNQRAIPILPPRIDRNIKPGFQPKYPVTNANTYVFYDYVFPTFVNYRRGWGNFLKLIVTESENIFLQIIVFFFSFYHQN